MTAAADNGPGTRVLVNVLGHFDVWHGEDDLTPPARAGTGIESR